MTPINIYKKGESIKDFLIIEDLGMQYLTKKSKTKTHMVTVKCPLCDNIFDTYVFNITRNHTYSCGCSKRELITKKKTKHDLSGTRIYHLWFTMRNRGNGKCATKYYKDRGITICDEWQKFENFYEWAMNNGYTDKLTIERKNNDLGYCPENCKWATYVEQANNRGVLRSNNKTGYNGVSYSTKNKKFSSIICYNHKTHILGFFKTAIEAAIVRNNFIKSNNLPVHLNIIPDV